MASEDELNQQLQNLQKQLGKKQLFEVAVSSIKSLLTERYPSASPSLRKSFYAVVCRVATVLKTRYTSPGFWMAGMGLFMEAEKLVSESSERVKLRTFIAQAQETLREVQDQSEIPKSEQPSSSKGYLFEGHLTVDAEPPEPDWLVQENLFARLSALGQNGADNIPTPESEGLMQEVIEHLNRTIPYLVEDDPKRPASKIVVANLPITKITDETLSKLEPDAKCAVCLENYVVGDEMQELPCKHTFHPPCLKPWLASLMRIFSPAYFIARRDENHSCPTCRSELMTDDGAYERRKEREKREAEARKGAANAVREGEYMYV